LGDHVETLIAAVGAVIAKPFDGGQDDAGIDLAEHVVADAHTVHASRGLILGDDIGLFHHLQKDCFALRVFEIEGDAPLIGVERHEVGAVHAGPLLPAVASGLAALRLFNFNHVGP
jgi:hypothetical protein